MAVDRPIAAGGHFRPDAEGLTIVYLPGGGGYLIASSQAGSNTLNSYLVYDRLGTNAFIREFRVIDGPQTDGCGWTDGIDALATNLGPSFPHGIFICQDNANSLPGTVGNQNFKFVPLERVVGLGLVDPPPPPGTVVMVVANPSSLIAGEVAVRNRLTNDGFSVSVIDDNLVTAADANGTAFVFVSSTADANTLRARLRDVPQPVWMAKPYLLDDMLMTGPAADVDYGNVVHSLRRDHQRRPSAGGRAERHGDRDDRQPHEVVRGARAGRRRRGDRERAGDHLRLSGRRSARRRHDGSGLPTHIIGVPERTGELHGRRMDAVRCRRRLRGVELRVGDVPSTTRPVST